MPAEGRGAVAPPAASDFLKQSLIWTAHLFLGAAPMNHSQNEALGSLANALTDLFQEAADLLPRMTEARQAGKSFPRRDPARLAAVVSALSFVEDGRRRFLTLAHIVEDETSHKAMISYQQQETLVQIAIDAETCRSIEITIPGLTRASGSIFSSMFGLKGGSTPAPDAALTDQYRVILLLKTQSIALRAVCLTHFVRFAMEYMTLCTPDTLFHPLDPAVPQRHFEALQRDLERLAPSLVDGPSTTAVLSSCSRLPWPPLVIAQAYDSNCDDLNGVPMTREHKAAWMKSLGDMQGSSRSAELRSA